MYLEKSSTVSVVVGLVCIDLMYRYRVLDYTLGLWVLGDLQKFCCLNVFFNNVHLRSGTNFLHSSSPTGPPITKPTPFDRGHSNALRGGFFRDSYPGAREIFEFEWPTSTYKFGKMFNHD
jgi:hypothetical protein